MKVVNDRGDRWTYLWPSGVLPHEVHEWNEQVGVFGRLLGNIVDVRSVNRTNMHESAAFDGNPHVPFLAVPKGHQVSNPASQAGHIEVDNIGNATERNGRSHEFLHIR